MFLRSYYLTDPFNCSNHCHLAWLLRNNRHLLEMINGVSGPPSCSNGTFFRDLKPERFWDCPFTNNTMNISHEFPTMFYVIRKSIYSTSGTTIPFETDRFNSNALAMNLTTSVFTAPEDGIYKVSFSGIVNHLSNTSCLVWISLRLNGNSVGSTFVNHYISKTAFAQSLILKVKSGDQIDLHLTNGAFYADYNFGAHFIGIVLEQIKQTIKTRTSPVYFYVQRNSSFSTVGSIPFELAQLNEGSAMDIDSGVFTAPGDGIYHFSLSGIKGNLSQILRIKLRLNGEMIGSAFTTKEWATYHLESILQLKKGDRIDLFLDKGTCFDDEEHWTHFIGYHFNTKYSVDENFETSQVYFYVQRNSSFSVNKGPSSRITFELARLNEGGAMNLTTGIFAAPHDGLYRFSLFGIRDNSKDELVIFLRKNRAPVKANYPYVPAVHFSAFTLQSILRLEKGDEIDLYLSRGSLVDGKDYHFTHFIGYLLQ